MSATATTTQESMVPAVKVPDPPSEAPPTGLAVEPPVSSTGAGGPPVVTDAQLPPFVADDMGHGTE